MTALAGIRRRAYTAPATALLFAAQAAGISKARIVARRDSGDETGDTSSVVGYAGVILG